MSVVRGDRAQNVKHGFTIYLHGENLTNENQSTEQAAPQTFREGLEHCPGVEPTRRNQPKTLLPQKAVPPEQFVAQRGTGLIMGRTFGNCVKFRMEGFKGIMEMCKMYYGMFRGRT